MKKSIGLILLSILLTHTITAYTQEPPQSKMQVSATILPSCIIQTDDFNVHPKMHCTQGFSWQEPVLNSPAIANSTIVLSNNTIITSIDF